jgi:hypothetical protein
VSESAAGLIKLGQMLSDPAFRKSFWKNPDDACDKFGLIKDDIPANVYKVLIDLTPEELRALAWVKESLKDAGVPPDGAQEMV